MTPEIFFRELKKLLAVNPKNDGVIVNSENCSYSNYIYDSKNLLYSFDDARCENGTYLFDSAMCVDSIDCDYTVEADNCYENSYGFKCFNSNYITICDVMRDCSYCYDCSNLQDCFGCVNLKNKSFCIFNRQLTEQQYREEVKKYMTLPSEKVFAMMDELKTKFPVKPSYAENNVNSPYGNFIYYSKNLYMCFDAAHDEDSGYLYDSFSSKFCYDMTYAAVSTEFSYQIVDSARMHESNYAIESNIVENSSYVFNCVNVKNCFGCVGLRYKEYCILNRQFSKEEYEKLLPALKKTVFDSGIGWNDLTY